MKNFVKAAVVAAGVFSFSQVMAKIPQDTTTAQKAKRDAKMVGRKTSHVAASGAAAITDKVYKGKCGPQGQTVYINNNDHFFYVSKKGHRVYLKKSELMDKKM